MNEVSSNWHAIKKETVFKKLVTSEEGLSEKEAETRLARDGKNVINEDKGMGFVRIFLLQFKSWLIYVLLFSVIIAIIIAHYLDASVIAAIVILNVLIGFFQQYKAEKTIKELKSLLVLKSKVLRDGILKIIEAENIAEGDVIFLKSGDKIPADCRIFAYENLEVNESILTGESLDVQKTDEQLKKDAALAERRNMLYAGTHIERGNCRAIVVSTGMNTEFGKITGMLGKIKEENTPLQRKIDKFARKISFFVLAIVFLLFIIGAVEGYEKYQMLLTAIALAIAAIPEGLPAVITIGLAFASKKMSQKKVIVKRLSASESLGSITVICTDKTGTITEGKMEVTEIYCSERKFIKKESSLLLDGEEINIEKEKDLVQILKTSVLCNNARFEKIGNEKEYEIIGEPTESSLVLNAFELGFNKKALTEKEIRIREFPFSSERKMMSIIRKDGEEVVYSKGGPEIILKNSHFELFNGKKIRLTDSKREQLAKEAERMQKNSLRVLGFAFKSYKEGEDAEKNLVFIGFMGMQDPPRKEVKNAVELCKSAGIRVKMVTGDSGITAMAIANQVGIYGEMIDGKTLDSMTDLELLKRIEEINIFARIEPKQKFRIVELLKIKGEEVAVTGDGVNDVLALKKADVGVAMGIRGSDAAREVADMILLDDNFASIVDAVEEGRTVYENIKKATKYLISINFSEILLVCFTILLSMPLPFLPLQLLWMNLVTDTIPAVAITKEKGENVMKKEPIKEKNILDNILVFILLAGAVTFATELAMFLFILNSYPINEVRTILITGEILFELFFVFVCRNEKIFGKNGAFSNKFIFYGVMLTVLVQIAVLYTSAGNLFNFTSLTLSQWLLVLPLGLSGLVIFGIGRWIKRGLKKKKKFRKT